MQKNLCFLNGMVTRKFDKQKRYFSRYDWKYSSECLLASKLVWDNRVNWNRNLLRKFSCSYQLFDWEQQIFSYTIFLRCTDYICPNFKKIIHSIDRSYAIDSAMHSAPYFRTRAFPFRWFSRFIGVATVSRTPSVCYPVDHSRLRRSRDALARVF